MLPSRSMKSSRQTKLLCAGLLIALVVGCAEGDRTKTLPGIPDGPIDAAKMKTEMMSALAERDTLDRATRIIGLVHRLDADNLEGAIEAHEESLRGLDREEVRVFMNGWARIDAKGALDRLATWRNPGVVRQGIAEVVFYWTLNGGAEEARAYALASLGKSDDDTETTRNVIVDSVVRGLASAGEHEQLTALLETFPSDRTRTWVMTQGMLQLYRKGLSDVQAWVDSIPWDAKNDLKRDALRSSLVSMAGADGPTAAAWLERVEDRLEKGEILEDLSHAWAQSDPLATIEWLRARPQSAKRSAALRAASFEFLKQKGPEAEAWIRANLDDPVIDTTMRFPLAQYLMSVDIQQALPVAEKIGRLNEKSNALKQILMMWSRTDYDAVKRYMAEVGVPADVERTVVGQNQMRKQKRAGESEKQG